jgi:hypothetical protein
VHVGAVTDSPPASNSNSRTCSSSWGTFLTFIRPDGTTLDDFKRGYSDLIDHILAQPPREMLARLLALNSEDFFMRFFYRVKDRAAQVYRCGA